MPEIVAGSTSREPAFRTDFQALRGLAILLVVLHHAKLPFLNAGYLGVDIFYVISGYLITRIIRKDIELGIFSFESFYFRRAKRLLPAAYTAFFFTTLLSAAFLTSTELQDYTKQLVGAVTFTGNIALWLQTGYFEGAANLKPLLHVWSLSIEEQYYLLLPAALVIVPRRYWIPGTAWLLISSLVLCLFLAPLRPSAAFYLLPTRAWELAMGSFGALAVVGPRLRAMAARLFWPAMAALIAIPFVPTGAPDPGLDAAIVCFATLVVILRCHPIWNDSAGSRMLARVGDFSYSLYLVHWPIFAFASNAYVVEVPFEARMGMVGISFVLGYLLYRFVERPIRRAEIRPSTEFVGVAVAASLALVAISLGIARNNPAGVDYAYLRRVNHGFGVACVFGGKFTPKPECRNSGTPKILVWGDSFAMHLIPGIAATTDVGVIQATKSVCGPFVGMAPMNISDYRRDWARQCLQFNQSVLDYLAATPSIEVVVLSTPFGQYVNNPENESGHHILRIIDGELVDRDPGVLPALEVMTETIAKIRSLGKRVVVVAPPPSAGFDIAACLERKASGKVILGGNSDCRIPISAYHRQQARVLEFLARLPRQSGVIVIRFDDLLCSAQSCATVLDGTFIYRDEGHFSYAGSRLIGQKMALGSRLLSNAR